jgi:hypothetical protein
MTDDPDRDYGAILDDVRCRTCDLPAYRTPVDGPPDPDRHGNRRWRIICPRPACDNSGSMTIPRHGGRLLPQGFIEQDDD